MVKVDNMNIFDCLNSTDKQCLVRLYLDDGVIHEACPDDILRSLSYKEAGKKVNTMGFDYENKCITFDCR